MCGAQEPMPTQHVKPSLEKALNGRAEEISHPRPPPSPGPSAEPSLHPQGSRRCSSGGRGGIGRNPGSGVGAPPPGCPQPAGAGRHLRVRVVFQNGHPELGWDCWAWGCPPRALARLLLWLVPYEAGDGFNLCQRICGPRVPVCPQSHSHGEAGVGRGFWHLLLANGFSCCAGDTALPVPPCPPLALSCPAWAGTAGGPVAAPLPLSCPLGRDCLPLALVALSKPLGPARRAGMDLGRGRCRGVPPAPMHQPSRLHTLSQGRSSWEL